MESRNPVLSPSEASALQACLVKRTTNAKVIACHLEVSEHAARKRLERAMEALGATDRFGAVWLALETGLIICPFARRIACPGCGAQSEPPE